MGTAKKGDEIVDAGIRSARVLIARRFADELDAAAVHDILLEFFPQEMGQGSMGSKELPRDYRGRGAVRLVVLPSGRKIVARLLKRGGMMRHVLRHNFFVLPFSSLIDMRPFAEFRILHSLNRNGIGVPVPAAAIIEKQCANLFYRGVLLTEFIPDVTNMLTLVEQVKSGSGSLDDLRNVGTKAGQEARRCLGQGVQHSDLHFGNVLFNASGQVFLVDFDKAVRLPLNAPSTSHIVALRERWCRSVYRHLSGHPKLAEAVRLAFIEGLSSA